MMLVLEKSKICKYKFKGFKCKEPIVPGQEYCILHLEFPNDNPESEEFRRIQELKHAKVDEKLKNRDFRFAGARLKAVIFSGDAIDLTTTPGSSSPLDFRDVHIRNNVYFNRSIIENGNILLTSAHIDGELTFAEAKIKGNIWLKDSVISCRFHLRKQILKARFV